MADSLSRNAKFNALAGYGYFAISSIVTLLVSPLLVGYLGASAFGVWKFCQKLLDFATIADGRASQALKWVIANKESKDDVEEKRRAIGSALKVWCYFLPFLIAVVTILVFILPASIKDLPLSEYDSVRIVGLILGANIILNPLLGIPDAVLVGINKGYRSTGVQSAWLVLSNAAMLLVAYLGYGIVEIAVVVLLTTVFNGACIFFVAKRSALWLAVRKPEKKQFNSFIGFSVWVLVWAFVSKLLLSSELLLLGFLSGAELVTHYSFTVYVVQLALAIPMLTGSAITPGLGRLFGGGEIEKFGKIVQSFREVIFFIAVVFAGSILALNQNFISLWVGEEYFLGDMINILIAISMVQLIMIRYEAQIQDVSLNIKNKVLIGLSSTLFSLLLAVLLYKWMGEKIEWIFIGIIVGRLGLNFIFPLMVNRIAKVDYAMTSNYAAGFFIMLAAYFVGRQLTIDSWLEFFLVSTLYMCMLLIISYSFLLSVKNKKLLLNKVLSRVVHR